ncbi:juvenile hormone acid O-methyltransferase-like [Amphibalanus amphitrite]|uniref:juvenile hormone acid O-methyltransferase-like n=1 Tax=Amphibalanus amphitrite TaxID=1232801 RepID=UPI001C91F35F|nr:juvenile hormone acid O-methyltransferase-like [Amphibalanus amphitrite]
MESPELYVGANGLQRREVGRLLPALVARLEWRDHHRLLDIGCGTGDVLTELLLPLLPCFGSALGVDVSEPMVQFATKTYGSERLRFRVADIGSAAAAAQIGLTFHRVVSLFCLHWVQNQRAALQNIHDLLVPGGEAILIFIANNKIYPMYEKVAAMPRWKEYMGDWRAFITPYQGASDPAGEFGRCAQTAGLEVRDVTAPESTFVYRSRAELEAALAAVSPFMMRVPERDRRDFIRDCAQEVIRIVGVDDKGAVTSQYQLIVAHLARRN